MPNRSPAVVHGSSLRQAYTLTEQGHFTEALQVLDLYLQEAPQDKRGWVLRAHVMLTMGHPEGALDSIERVTHIDPADPMPWVIQGTALSTMGDYASALHSLENALVADPENRDAHELRRAVIDRIEQQESELQYQQAWYELAELQYRMGRHEDALPNLERSLRQNSADPAGWGLKACVLWALNRQEEAIQDIGRSIQLRGEDDWAYGVRGTMLKDVGRFDEALRDIESALRINPAREDLVALRRTIQSEARNAPRPTRVPDPLPIGNHPQMYEQMTAKVDPVLLAQELSQVREEPGISPAVRVRRAPNEPMAPIGGIIDRPVNRKTSGRLRANPIAPPVPANPVSVAPQAPAPAELPLEDVNLRPVRSQPVDQGQEQLRHAMEEAHHCYARNDYRAAAALYEKIALQAASRDKHMAALAWLYRGRCHYALREFEQALTCYESVAHLAPENASWLEHGLTLRHLGRYQDAMAWFDKCVEAGQSLDTAWVQKGHCALHLKQTAEAVVCYQHATEANPSNAHAWFSLAQSMSVEGKLQGAYEAVTRGLTVEVRNASGLELLGDILCLMGRLVEARSAYEKAVEIEPIRERAVANADALRIQPDVVPETVRKRYSRSIKERPKAKEPDRLSAIRDQMASHKFEEAWNALEAQLAKGAPTAPELGLKAALLSELGRWEDAALAGQDAVRIDPRSFEGHYEQAKAMTSLKRYQEALKEAEASIKLHPRDGQAWALRGTLMAHLGDADEVKRCFESAESFSPNDPLVLIRKATAMDVLGYPEAAIELYQKALAVSPQHPEALAEMAVTLAALGRRQEAYKYAQEALKVNPYQVTALEWSARLRYVVAGGAPPTPAALRPTSPSGRPSNATLGGLPNPPAPAIGRPGNETGGPPIRYDTRRVTKPDFSSLAPVEPSPSAKGGPPSMATRRRGPLIEGASSFELMRLARDAYERGAFEESVHLYDSVLRQDEMLSGAWFGKGLCNTAMWQFEEAREALERASELPDPPTEQFAHARKRLDAMMSFFDQSIKPLLAKELRAWRIFTAPSGAFRLPYPSWCQTFPPSGTGELAYIADRSEKPTFLFTVTAQPFVDPRDLTMVKHGEQVVDEGELPHPQASVDVKEVRDRNKGSFSLRAVLIKGHMAWYLVGSARFHYYAGYRQLFQMMVTDFHLA